LPWAVNLHLEKNKYGGLAAGCLQKLKAECYKIYFCSFFKILSTKYNDTIGNYLKTLLTPETSLIK
jgi:hypothetical protein